MICNDAILLKKIYRSSKTAMDAIKIMAEKSESEDLENVLTKQRDKYFDIAEDANILLRYLHELPEDATLFSQFNFFVTMKFGVFAKKDTHDFAELLIEGCMGGVMEMIREIKSQKCADSKCIDLAHILIETEQDTISLLERFL